MHGNNEIINLKDDILQEILGNFNHIFLKLQFNTVQHSFPIIFGEVVDRMGKRDTDLNEE